MPFIFHFFVSALLFYNNVWMLTFASVLSRRDFSWVLKQVGHFQLIRMSLHTIWSRPLMSRLAVVVALGVVNRLILALHDVDDLGQQHVVLLINLHLPRSYNFASWKLTLIDLSWQPVLTLVLELLKLVWRLRVQGALNVHQMLNQVLLRLCLNQDTCEVLGVVHHVLLLGIHGS